MTTRSVFIGIGLVMLFVGCVYVLIHFLTRKQERYGLLKYTNNNNIITNAEIDDNGLINVEPEMDDELPFINYHKDSHKYNYNDYVRNHRQRNSYNSKIHANIL
jgi:hypothetical protein